MACNSEENAVLCCITEKKPQIIKLVTNLAVSAVLGWWWWTRAGHAVTCTGVVVLIPSDSFSE